MLKGEAGRLALLLLAAAVAAAGCGGGGGNEYRQPKIGFSMALPEGWGQGEPGPEGGFYPTSTGFYFYADASKDEPFGSVLDYPMEGDSLEEYVDAAVKQTLAQDLLLRGMMRAVGDAVGGEVSEAVSEDARALETKLSSKEALAIGGLEAYTTTIESPDFVTREVYILKDDTVLYMTFRAPADEWDVYGPLIDEATKTIKVK